MADCSLYQAIRSATSWSLHRHAVEAKDFTYNGSACRGYDVKLTLTYAETEVESLKKSMTISVIEIQDYEYDRTKNYKKDVIYDGEMKNVYRVLAVE